MTKPTVTARVELPHPRWRLPVLGDLLTIDLSRPSQGLAREMARHNGIVEQRIFDFPVVVVSDVDLVNEVNDEAVWDRPLVHHHGRCRRG